MKLSCEIYEDLLLLYEDGLCSEETKKLVEEHLAGCDRCSRYLKKMRLPEEMAQEETAGEESEEDAQAEKESIRKSFRKIKRRWALSLLILPLLLLLAVPAMMIANEVRGEGICFSNLDDIWRCHRFWKLVAEGEYEKATEMLDYSSQYDDVRATLLRETWDGQIEEVRQFYVDVYGDVLNMTQEEFEHQEQQKVAAYLRANQPVMLRSYSYADAYKVGDTWVIKYDLKEGVKNPDQVEVSDVYYSMSLDVTAEGLRLSSSSIPIPLFETEEELVIYNAFDISRNQVVEKIYDRKQRLQQ